MKQVSCFRVYCGGIHILESGKLPLGHNHKVINVPRNALDVANVDSPDIPKISGKGYATNNTQHSQFHHPLSLFPLSISLFLNPLSPLFSLHPPLWDCKGYKQTTRMGNAGSASPQHAWNTRHTHTQKWKTRCVHNIWLELCPCISPHHRTTPWAQEEWEEDFVLFLLMCGLWGQAQTIFTAFLWEATKLNTSTCNTNDTKNMILMD